MDYVRAATATFTEAPFNNIDALVFCQIFYPKLEVVLDGDGVSRLNAGYRVRDFWRNEYADEMFCDEITDRDNIKFFAEIAASRRFRDIKISNLVAETTASDEKQFAACRFGIDEETDFVCFRGTDGSLLGWKEDFNLSFMKEVPSQGEAVDYINRFYGPGSEGEGRKLYIGGHSKGGNLAVYGGIKCDPSIHDRILGIYSLDGPGFRDEVVDELHNTPGREKLNIIKIVPQSSVIGMLLQNQGEYFIIHSKAVGIMQHSAYTWQMLDDDFQYVDNMSHSGELVDRTVHEWLMNATDEERERFSSALFDTLFANDINTVHDLKHLTPSAVAGILRELKDMDEPTQETVRSMLKGLARAGFEASIGQLRQGDDPE